MNLRVAMPRLSVLRQDTAGLDRILLMAVGVLLVVGMVAIHSATITAAGGGLASSYLLRHVAHLGVGLLLGGLVWRFLPLRVLRDRAVVLVGLAIGALLLVHLPVIGVAAKGAARWLDLGPFNLQPVELTKLALLVYVCHHCATHRDLLHTWQGLRWPLGTLAVAVAFLLLQPDFGSAVILIVLVSAALFLAGATLKLFVGALVLVPATLGALVLISPYRMKRMLAFLDPFQDPLGGGYQQSHSLMAFGKGGWFGEGLGLSVEKWSHLPEAHTDFVIAVIAEETGILGVLCLLALYAVVLWRTLAIAQGAERRGDMFANLFARVVSLMLILHMFINISGNLALGPVKGLTLPLVSYGGSSMVTWLVTLALVQVIAHENHEAGIPSPPRASPPGWGVT